MAASYVGLDGITGLSVLKLARNSLPGLQSTIYAKESSIVVGQQVHIFGPEPVARGEEERDGPVYVKLGETEGKITRISRVPSGGIARVEITSAKVSAVNTGAVVLNDAGETVGIIDSVKGNAATVLPAALIRGAARRVLEKQSSVPRPWLGIRGELLGAFPVEQLLRNGWESQKARLLAEQRRGILLTSVAPGSPASTAALHPGDVILEVNRGEVRSAEDFSWFLEEAGPGGSLQFTVARPGSGSTEAIEVKLSESPDPLFGVRTQQFPSFFTPGAQSATTSGPAGIGFAPGYSPLANGVETIAILPKVAARWGSTGGLLVVYLEPSTFAYRAGLRTGDVIESINGQLVSADPEAIRMLDKPGGSYEFRVVRNKQKLQFVVVTHEDKQ
jgi:S1-C subfamily serine protease